MARKTRKPQAERLAHIAPAFAPDLEHSIAATLLEDAGFLQEKAAAVAAAIAEVEADHAADHEGPNAPRGKSVVPLGYKKTYATRAVIAGQTSKAAKRQCGDWLAKELLAECVPDGKTFDLPRFLAILEANGIDAARWPSRSNGWEGRLRMSGAIVLRGVVGRSGEFRTPEATIRLADLPEAANFLAKWDGRNG